MAKKSIKLWDGWKLSYDGKETICKTPPEVWEYFGWDIENDPDASECASIITREMYCFGYMDLSALCPGHTLTAEVIPVGTLEKEEEEDWEE